MSDNPSAVKPDFKADINPNSLEVVKGAMLEVGIWSYAKRAYEEAKEESRRRFEKAKAMEASTAPNDPDAPSASVEQLVGNEVVRFQGLRVAYFALDSDSIVKCLNEKDATPGIHSGDTIILNRIVSLKEDVGKSA